MFVKCSLRILRETSAIFAHWAALFSISSIVLFDLLGYLFMFLVVLLRNNVPKTFFESLDLFICDVLSAVFSLLVLGGRRMGLKLYAEVPTSLCLRGVFCLFHLAYSEGKS